MEDFKLAETFENELNKCGIDYDANAKHFVQYAHRYLQNEGFKFMLAVMREMAKGGWDGRNKYAHSLSKKIIEFLDENDFVYLKDSEMNDEMIPFQSWLNSTAC